MPRFYGFDATPDLAESMRRSAATGVEQAFKSATKAFPEEEPSFVSKIGGVPVGFQFGTYLGLKGPSAFVVDIITDPTTYIPFFGLLNKGVRGVAGLTKAGLAARASKEIAEGIAKHPAGSKLLKGLMDETVEMGARGLPVAEQVKQMKYGFQTAAALAGNDEAAGLVKSSYELFQQSLTLDGKAKRRALAEVEQMMGKARKIIRNDANAGRLASEVFSSKNVQGFGHAIRMRQDAVLAPLGATMAEQAYKGQRKLLHGYVPFSELWSKTGEAQDLFSVTGAPLFGVADAVAGIGRIATKPVKTGIAVLDRASKAALFGTQTAARLSVTADDILTSTNRAVEATTGRLFTELRRDGEKLVAPGVRATAAGPEEVFIRGSEGKAVPFLNATATERIQAALHAGPDAELAADNFVAGIDTARFEVDKLTTEMRTMIQQVHGGGEAGARVADARARLLTLAWQSPVDEATGLNAAGLIPVVTERVSATGVKVPLVQFERPGVAQAFGGAAGADLNLALDVAKGVDPMAVAKPVTDEELFLANTVAEAYNRMGLELANEGLQEEFVKIYGARIVRLTPRGKAQYAKGVGAKVAAGLSAAADDTSVPEEVLGFVKQAFDFNPQPGAAGKAFQKQRRASWEWLNKGERDGLWTLERDAFKAFNVYMKSASEVLYKHGYLKSLRALGEDAFGRVVMNADEYAEAGGAAFRTAGPTAVRPTALSKGREFTPSWKYVPADSIVGFNAGGQRYYIREDVFSVLDKLPQFKPGGLFLSGDPQTGKFVNGLLAINALSKRTLVSLSQFHKFVLAGSLVSDQGFGLFTRKVFDQRTNTMTSTLDFDVVKAAAAGGVKGAALGAAAGAAFADDPVEGAVGGAVAAFLPSAAFASAKQFSKVGKRIYGDGADIALTGIKAGLSLEIDDAALSTLDRMAASVGTTPIPFVSKGGARQRNLTRALGSPIEHFDNNLWREFYPGAKIMAFGNLYAEAMKENVVKNLGLTPDQVAKNVAQHVNMTLGGLTWRKLGVSPHMRKMLNGLWFAPDWTAANLLGARDVFANMTPVRSALAGALTGVAADAVVNGFDPDDMTMKGAVAAATMGGIGGLAFRGAVFAFGQKISKDIVRGTPLQEWMAKNTASLSEMRDIMGKATDAYKASKGVRLVAQSDPEFASFAVDFTKKELARQGKFLPDEMIPNGMKSGADEMRAAYARRYYKNALISMAVMGNVANYAMNGHFMWDNPDGYKLDVMLPGKDSAGRHMFMNVGKQYMEPFEWAADPGKRLKGKVSTLLQTGVALGANEDFMGRPIIVSDGGILTQFGEAAAYSITEMFVPIPGQPLIEAAMGNKDPRAAITTTAGLTVKTQFKPKQAAPRLKAPSLSSPPPIGRTSLRPNERF